MKNRLLTLRDKLSASYWFIPTVMAILAVVLSILTIKLDEVFGDDIHWVTGLVYVNSPEGARAVLSTVASSMINVAGVVFSLTMVVLSLTSQQYGPLVLTHFMRDRANQFVLGVFTATFIYCLLILRTVRGTEGSLSVPHISVLFGLGLSILSLAVLIYFIHHVSQSIQAPKIIDRINNDLMDTLEDIFPADLGEEPPRPIGDEQALFERFDREAYTIETDTSGYLQMVDDEVLLETARNHQLVLRLDLLPGRFLFKGQALVRVRRDTPMTDDREDIRRKIQGAFIFGSRRTRTQDVEFVITQLNALAVRSLSPGINDPYTAIMVINHLGEALCTMLHRHQPSKYRFDEDQQLRVIAAKVTFETLFHTAFDQIVHYGYGDPLVVTRLLQVFRSLWDCSDDAAHCKLLQKSAASLYEESRKRLSSSELEALNEVYLAIINDFNVQADAANTNP